MSPPIIVINKVCFYFVIKPTDLQQEYQTAGVTLSDMTWKIKLKKRSVEADGNKKELLDVFLICSPGENDRSFDWICEADAIIALRAVDSQQRVYEKILRKMEFSKERLSSASLEFINFADLKNYEQNKRLVFDVQIRADPKRFCIRPYYAPNVQQIHSTFQFIVDDVIELEQTSTLQYLAGTTFRISVIRDDQDLSIFLRHENSASNEHWSWNVKFGIKLLSFDPNVQPIAKQFEKNLYFEVVSWGYRQFTTWQNFIDPENSFVQNGKSIFEIDLAVDPPKPLLPFDEKKTTTESSNQLVCSICLLSIIDRSPTATICGHLFCGRCIERSIRFWHKCPLCNADLRTQDVQPIFF